MSESAAFMAPIPVTPAIPPLITRLVEQFDATWIGSDNLDAWLAEGGNCLLLLCGDPVRHPESLDVAVVLPELRQEVARRHGCTLRLGVVHRAEEEAIAARFALRRWPTLVWLRDGGYVTTIDGMHDWDEYLSLADKALNLSNARIPLFAETPSGATGGCQ
ncbi:MAG: hydrogenase [Pseudomonas sp.]|jgi:hydrogenase-1 operon protein HyaE|uniref:hydrogenase n=1 Tax=Pseudomonas sp. UMAB-08 TaxID=1365375 RepID=UPI001C5645D8|nr:hydrogenase [Pseudomonas sp. UMAB-08]